MNSTKRKKVQTLDINVHEFSYVYILQDHFLVHVYLYNYMWLHCKVHVYLIATSLCFYGV